MKLRFRSNSLRLRVNKKEVQALVAGERLEEQVVFPGDSILAYILEPGVVAAPAATFSQGTIRILAPSRTIEKWAEGEDLGMYFEFPANGAKLKVAIEKDLECMDGPPEEADEHAFPRLAEKIC